MIVFLVTDTRESYERGNGGHPQKLRLEGLSGQPCLVQHYEEASLKQLKALGVTAVVFGGYATGLDERRLAGFRGVYELVREGDIPLLGLCGGHQMIAELWAAHNDRRLTRMGSYPIRRLRRGESDPNAAYHPGHFKEWGFYPIAVVRRDPLLAGLKTGFMASEAHYREVKTLPRDFVLLASTPEVRVQAYRHKSRAIYGAQFHCEAWTDAYPAGKRVLENFFRLAGTR